MKTRLFFGVVAMALLTACDTLFTQKETIEIDFETSDITFSAVTEGQTGSRTALSDKADGAGYYSLYWTKGDAISISDGKRTAIFTTESNKVTSGEFTAQQGSVDRDAAVYTAFYPSSITASYMVLPYEQHYVANNVKDFPMYAQSTTQSLSFKNLCGIVRLSLKSEETGSLQVSRIRLHASNAGMSGNFYIGKDNAAIVMGNNGVVLTCDKPVPLYKNTVTDFNIVVPQGDYSPLNVTIYDANGEELNFVSKDKVHVSRSGITRLALTLGSSEVDGSLERIPITDADVEFTDR